MSVKVVFGHVLRDLGKICFQEENTHKDAEGFIDKYDMDPDRERGTEPRKRKLSPFLLQVPFETDHKSSCKLPGVLPVHLLFLLKLAQRSSLFVSQI